MTTARLAGFAALAISASLGGFSQAQAEGGKVETFTIAPETDLVSLNVLFGYQTGCSSVQVDVDVKREGNRVFVSRKVLPLPSNPDDVIDFPIYTCQAEMPVVGQAFLEVNGESVSELEIIVDAEPLYLTDMKLVQLRQFSAID